MGMYAWSVQYKKEVWGAFVIEATPAKAKARFHEHFKDGELKDVRCYDQRRAEGFDPAVIDKADDPRVVELGLRFRKKKEEEGEGQ